MGMGAGMIALSESFRVMAGAGEVLDALESRFRSLGATHLLITGVPLPARPIEPLILRAEWRDVRHDRAAVIQSDDVLVRETLCARAPVVWKDATGCPRLRDSVMLAAVGTPVWLIGVPICAFLPYQAVVIAGGHELSIDTSGCIALGHVCSAAFARLFELGYLKPERPGDLSARERRVVALSASGKTAREIAHILDISQRTVHAHLQNASEKLRASNKTHTVVEALRYGQITV